MTNIDICCHVFFLFFHEIQDVFKQFTAPSVSLPIFFSFSSVYGLRTTPLIIDLIYPHFTPIIQNIKSKQMPCG